MLSASTPSYQLLQVTTQLLLHSGFHDPSYLIPCTLYPVPCTLYQEPKTSHPSPEFCAVQEVRRLKPIPKLAVNSVASWHHPRAPSVEVLATVKGSQLWYLPHPTRLSPGSHPPQGGQFFSDAFADEAQGDWCFRVLMHPSV